MKRPLDLPAGGEPPLVAMRRRVEERGALDAADLRGLAAELSLPPAAVRSAVSFYADLGRRPGAALVCRGTSCELAAGRLGGATPAGREPVYCLGYCDRSPAGLDPAGEIELAGSPAAGVPPPPSIRARGVEPIVTRHLLDGGCSRLETARRAGVYRALDKGLERGGPWVLDEVERSGERGRGGAAFPTAAKWRRCAAAAGEPRWVIANGDEGDPGSFIDRVLMERDPHSLIEGMLLCALAVGARRGLVFVRSEYPAALAGMRAAVEEAAAAGLLGPSVLGSGLAFDLTVFPAMGSYVCGEETALLNAIEGGRGEVRLRPPYPAEAGLFGRPTVVNNVETLAGIPWIVERGAEAYRALGTGSCSGTKALCLNQGFARPGIVEVEFGIPLAEVIQEEAGGGRDGAGLDAVLLGGPMGSLLGPAGWEVPVCYDAMARRGVSLGHGGLVAIPEGTDPAALARHLLEFVAAESCGKCVPCSLGSARALEIATRGLDTGGRAEIRRLLEVMEQASLCAFGRLTPGPVRALLDRLAPSAHPPEGAAE